VAFRKTGWPRYSGRLKGVKRKDYDARGKGRVPGHRCLVAAVGASFGKIFPRREKRFQTHSCPKSPSPEILTRKGF